jgi:hypothetical protein
MTIAELHGKISHSGINLHDQLEDLLTSDVFSACKYTRAESLLLPFLRSAKSLEGQSLAGSIPSTVIAVKYRFWPLLRRGEPDLLISLQLDSGKHILVLIEAKYFSFKSGSALEEEQLEIAHAPSDQLAREYLDLLEAHRLFHIRKSDIAFRSLIYVTAHRLMPEADLQESIREINHFKPSEKAPAVYWTNWFGLHPILARTSHLLDWEKPILKDLKLLLERKHLVQFQGFSRLIHVSEVERGSIYRTSIMPHFYQFDLVPVEKTQCFYTKSPG